MVGNHGPSFAGVVVGKEVANVVLQRRRMLDYLSRWPLQQHALFLDHKPLNSLYVEAVDMLA